jgi:hypothetical protein
VLLTLGGWTSPKVADAFAVWDDMVRLWCSNCANGGVEALKASVAPGPAPVKSEAALRVVTPLLEQPVADRPDKQALWPCHRDHPLLTVDDPVVGPSMRLNYAPHTEIRIVPARTILSRIAS